MKNTKKFDDLIKKANKYFKDEDFHNAFIFFKNAYKTRVINSEVREKIFISSLKIFNRLNNEKLSLIILYRLIYSYFLIVLSIISIKQNKFKLYQKAFLYSPNNQKIAYLFINHCKQTKKNKIAIQLLKIIIKENSKSLWPYKFLAELYQLDENLEEEFKIREKICELLPNDKEAKRILKLRAEKLTFGQSSEDIELILLDKIQNDSDNINHYIELTDYYINKRDFEKAIGFLNDFLKSSFNSRIEKKLFSIRDQHLNLLMAKATDNENQKEINRLKKLRYELQIHKFMKKIKREPNNLQLRYEYGKILLNHGNPRDAIPELELASNFNKRRLQSLLCLSEAFNNIGQKNKALEILEEVGKETEKDSSEYNLIKKRITKINN